MSKGFTLIEIFIVLVIISVVIGSINATKNIIHATKLSSVMIDINKLKSMTDLYVEKYKALPGDHPNASLYWPSVTNGNGDGMTVSSIANVESSHFWSHLVAAQSLNRDELILNKNFNGIIDGVGPLVGKRCDENYSFTYADNRYGTWYSDLAGHVFFFGCDYYPVVLYSYATGKIISPADAHSIDKKNDDGLSDKGHIRTRNADTNAVLPRLCLDVNDQYNLSHNDKACYIAFKY